MSVKEKEESVSLPSQKMLDLSPINTMLADKKGKLIYMNQNSKETLKKLESLLPAPVEDLVGKSIDWFHKNPDHQKKIIANPANLPHRAIIQLGIEKLDLLVTAIYDDSGDYVGPMVTWDIVTEKLKLETEMAQAKEMVDKSPINTMMCAPDGTLVYLNEKSIATLKTLEKYLPIPVEKAIGQKIDVFHKNPEHQRQYFSNPSKLPHRAIISLGPEKLDLNVSAVVAGNGDYLGAMVNWDVVTTKVELVDSLQKSSDQLASSANTLQNVSTSLSSAAEETSAQANTASAASEEVNAGVQTVTSNMDEMT
ncbi:hypothetical protein OAT67_09270, partial [Bacteriovoracaceae bacterium]|nr:hypothetical protein [Bacteriovoracaceae bacterium]